MHMNQYDVAVIGEIYIDHIFTGFATWPQPGEEAFARNYYREIGGGAANTACALGRLGRSVNLIGVIGESDAAWFEQRLQDYGVSVKNIRRTSGNTGVTASVSMVDDRSFFTYVGENERLTSILGSDDVLSVLKLARHIHFALPLSRSVAKRMLPTLRAAGCTTSLDVGFQLEWLRDEANFETCCTTDYFLPNEREALILSGGTTEDYLTFAQSKGLRRPVIKLGPSGAAMRVENVTYKVSSPIVEVVDTTGAGDAFDAGFIDALLDGVGSEQCLRRGCICGGLSTRQTGALRALPRREEISDIYEQTYAS
jgi:sugar/nucleoside kinase (ribokinase family)